MLKIIYLISFLLFFDISKVNALECYYCDDCSTVNASTPVETCGATATSTTTAASTTTSQSSSTTSPSTGQTTPSTSSSTLSTISSSSLTSASTLSTSASTPSTSASTLSASPSTLPTSASTPPTSASTPPTSASTNPSISASTSSSDTPDPIIPPIESPDENEEIIENFRVIRARRDIMRAESRVDYVCVTLSVKVNNTDHKSRGCVAKPGNDDVCKAILQEAPNATCTSCNTDKCNSASSLQNSLFLVFIVTVAKLALQ